MQLWLRLERTEAELTASLRRFSPRAVIRMWLPGVADDDLIWKVCHLAQLEGYEQLPHVPSYPRKHRELLRAIIAMALGIGIRQVDVHALDSAFSIAFPFATPLNIRKKTLPLPLRKGGEYNA
ncbi:MAG: hypothetical protein KBT20_06480 [Bacteroidales bacterium]|nr:hypothetical protein [Candidatus Liminaster caballi]